LKKSAKTVLHLLKIVSQTLTQRTGLALKQVNTRSAFVIGCA